MINYLNNLDYQKPEVETPQDFSYKELRDKYPELSAVSKREYTNNQELQEQLTGARINGSTWRDDIDFDDDMIIGQQRDYSHIEEEESILPQEETQFAYGGNDQDSLTGNRLTEFNGGGTHEENSLGGIPLGLGANGKRNSVEEGETRYEFDEGGYIFSNRINTKGLFRDL